MIIYSHITVQVEYQNIDGFSVDVYNMLTVVSNEIMLN